MTVDDFADRLVRIGATADDIAQELGDDVSAFPSLNPPTAERFWVFPGGPVTLYPEWYAGGSSDGQQAGSWGRNATVTRIAVGRWNVALGVAHPDGTDYHASFNWEESPTLRDNPKIGIEEGSKTANGFTIMITIDDNGGTADGLIDQPWSFGICAPVVFSETSITTP